MFLYTLLLSGSLITTFVTRGYDDNAKKYSLFYSLMLYVLLAGIYMYLIDKKLKKEKNKEIKSKEKQYNKVMFDGDMFANRMLYTLLGSSIVVPVSGALYSLNTNYDWIPKAMFITAVLAATLIAIIIGIVTRPGDKVWLAARFAYYCIFIFGLIPYIYKQIDTEEDNIYKTIRSVAIIAGMLTTIMSIVLFLITNMTEFKDYYSVISIMSLIFGGLILIGSVWLGFKNITPISLTNYITPISLTNYTDLKPEHIVAGTIGAFIISMLVIISLWMSGTAMMLPMGIILLIIFGMVTMGMGVSGMKYGISKQIGEMTNERKLMMLGGLIIFGVASGITGMFVGWKYGLINGFILISILMGILFKHNTITASTSISLSNGGVSGGGGGGGA